MIRLTLFTLIILLTCLQVFGQDDQTRDYTHKELLELSVEDLLDLDVKVQVVSAQGENLFNSSSTVTIINKETIRDYNFQSIKEALQTAAGFSVYNTYLKKDIPTSRGILQDHYANKVLVMINGIPTFHAITGEGNLDRIDIHDVERIEILKGPASVLYGSNAYGGAINIVLKATKNQGVESHAGFGINDIYSAGANTNTGKNDFKLFVSGNSQSYVQNESDYTDGNGESGFVSDIRNNQNITLLAKYKGSSILLNGYSNSEGFLGVFANYASGANIPQKLKGYLINYRYNNELNDLLELKADAAIDWNYRSFARDRNDSIRSEVLGYRINTDLKAILNISKHFTLDIGALFDYRTSFYYTNYMRQNQEVISHNNLKNRNILEQSYYGQANIKTGKLISTLGVRYTINELYGGNFSPRASFVYAFNKNNAIKFIYGESYRAPSLFELYFMNPDSTVFGNEELLPERLTSFEIAYLKSYKHLFFQVLGYHSIHKNKIQRIVANIERNNRLYPGQIIYMNGNQYQSYGIEAEIKYNNPKIFQVFLNYNYCAGNKGDTIGNNNHYNFKYIPKNQLSTGINKSFKQDFFVSALFHFWSNITGPLENIPAQTTLDFNIGYKQILKRVGVIHTLSFRNVLNSELETPEYVRGNINTIPVKNGLSIFYTIKMDIN